MRIGLAVKTLALGTALLLMPIATVEAAIITFEAPTVGQFTGSQTESGFIYSQFSGGLFVNNLGDPGQDMEGWTQQAGGVLQITRVGGSLFTFDGLDFAAVDSSSPTPSGSQTLLVTGLLGGSTVGSESFTLASAAPVFGSPSFYPNWTTFAATANNLAGQSIDTLRVTLLATALSNESIDNVQLTPVATTAPEPGTILLVTTGVAVGAAARRRRRRAL
jgi:hypothetical protein